MNDLTNEETEYLMRLLERRHTELLHELHHATHRSFKQELRSEIDLAERLYAKLTHVHV